MRVFFAKFCSDCRDDALRFAKACRNQSVGKAGSLVVCSRGLAGKRSKPRALSARDIAALRVFWEMLDR